MEKMNNAHKERNPKDVKDLHSKMGSKHSREKYRNVHVKDSRERKMHSLVEDIFTPDHDARCALHVHAKFEVVHELLRLHSPFHL